MKQRYAALLVAATLIGTGCSLSRDAAKRSYLENGQKLLERGQVADACIQFRKALQKDDHFGEAYYRLGVCASRQGDLEQSVLALAQASELLPNRSDVKVQLAESSIGLFLRDHEWPAHEQAMKALKSLDPNSYAALRLRGIAAFVEGKPVDAIPYLKRADEIKPMQPDLVHVYVQCLLKGNANEAQQGEDLGKALQQQHPAFFPIYDVLYTRYMATGRTAEAEAMLQQEVTNNRSEGSALIKLAGHYVRTNQAALADGVVSRLLASSLRDRFLLAGDFYTGQGKYGRALEVYREGRTSEHSKAPTYELRSVQVLRSTNRTDEALKVISDGLHTYPNSRDLLQAKCSVLVQRGGRDELKQAEQIATYLLNQENRPQYHELLGEVWLSEHSNAAAAKEFSVAAQTPGYFEPVRHLANVALQQHDYAGALQRTSQVLAAYPSDVEMRTTRAIALRGQGKLDEAERQLTPLFREASNNVDVRLEMASLRFSQRRFKDAESILQDSANRTDPRVIQGLAQVYFGEGRPDKAVSLIRTNISADRQSAELRLLLAEAEFSLHDLNAAAQDYRVVLEQMPHSAFVHVRYGDALLRSGHSNDAIQQFRTAYDLAGDRTEAASMLALTYEQVNAPEDAIRMYREVLKSDHHNPSAMNNLAYLLAQHTNKLDEALQLAQEAHRQAPKSAQIADTMGWIYLKKHSTDAAMQIFSTNARQAPSNPLYKYHLALAQLQRGDRASAKQNLDLALANKPSDTDQAAIRQTLAQLKN